jgi:hypothetical protein
LKSAAADIGGIAPLCNAACLMKGLRREHGLASGLRFRSFHQKHFIPVLTQLAFPELNWPQHRFDLGVY